MRVPLHILPILALASCSGADEQSSEGPEVRLCTAAEAGAAASAKAAELLDTVRQRDRGKRETACARFGEIIEDGSKAGIPDAPGCRWDSGNTNGNPHFLVSLHLTQLKGQAREMCGNLK
jgi:hypothetical protein